MTKKSLGQHFLHDRRILGKIVSAAGVSRTDRILEIGPGTGILTEMLAQEAKRVVTIEKDEKLCALLEAKFSSSKNVEIICGDALNFNPTPYTLSPYNYKIIANIPYYITGRLLRLMYGAWPIPKLAVLMLQKEVALRLTTKPPKLNRLAAIIQLFAECEIITTVGRRSFAPPPDVDSAILRITTWAHVDPAQLSRTAAVVNRGFVQPRKYLYNNLKGHYGIEKVAAAFEKMRLPGRIRPSELSRRDWLALSTLLLK